jgi:hypothetical protein
VASYSYRRDESLVKLFLDEHVKEGAPSSVRSHDRNFVDFRREFSGAVERGRETLEFGHLPSTEGEVEAFLDRFEGASSRSQSVADARLEAHVLKVAAAVDDRASSARTPTPAATIDDDPQTQLESHLDGWFQALGYQVERLDSARWRLRVKARLGQVDDILVLAVATELTAAHVRQLATSLSADGPVQGWAVAAQRVSPAAANLATELGSVLCYTIDTLIEDSADFDPYFQWLEATNAQLHLEHPMLHGNWPMFAQLNRMGRLVVIFDGFDEMAARISWNEVVKTFWELAKIVSRNSKIIITSRREFFPTDAGSRTSDRRHRGWCGEMIGLGPSLVARLR